MEESDGPGEDSPGEGSRAALVYALVRALSPGRATTYGAIAREVGLTPRQVGRLMRLAPPDVPWQRVVAAGGRIATHRLDPALGEAQIGLLKAEGVAFDGLRRVERRFLLDPD